MADDFIPYFDRIAHWWQARKFHKQIPDTLPQGKPKLQTSFTFEEAEEILNELEPTGIYTHKLQAILERYIRDVRF